MNVMVRALSIMSAAVHVLLVAAAVFVMWFAAVFPFENQSPEEAAADDWLLVAAPLIGLFALAVGAATIAGKVKFAAAALSAESAVGAIVLIYALGESDHSDGKLMLCSFAIVLAGVVAGVATRRAGTTIGERVL